MYYVKPQGGENKKSTHYGLSCQVAYYMVKEKGTNTVHWVMFLIDESIKKYGYKDTSVT